MNRILTTLFLFLVSTISFAQTCPGDINILEDENISVWEVVSNGTQIFSLAGFAEMATIGGTTYTQPNTGFERGLILMAHDLSGTLLWSTQLNATNTFFTTNPALAASTSTVYVSATSNEFDTSTNSFRIESFNALNGTPGWSNSYSVNVGSSNLPFEAQVNPYSAALDGTGKLVIAGAFSGTMDIGGTVLTTTSGLSETFVIAVDEVDGTDRWAVQSTGSNGRGRAWTLEVDNVGSIIIGGHYTRTITFGAQTFSAADDKINPYVAKLNNTDGSAQWLVGMQNIAVEPEAFENIYDLAVDPLDNIYFAGNFNNNLDIQGTTITSGGETDMLIGSLDPGGTLRWAKQFGGLSTADEFASSIVYSNNLSAIFVGGQLATDAPQYGNINLDLPPTNGHYVIGLLTDGTIEPIAAEAVSQESNFGYSATYIESSDTYISASLNSNSGTNILAAQWVPNRPVPFAHITLEDGILNPTETLTAFDPGGGLYTYQWYFNGVAIPDEVNTTYSAGLNGFYSLEVTNSNGCSKFSEEITLLDGSTLESDSLALVDLYNKTDGDNWNDKTNWLVGDVSTWSNVAVVGNRVTALRLNSNNLNGTFAPSITNLSELTLLELGGNSISGTLPTSIGNLTNLTEFAIWGNQMSGSIPSTIGDMTSLFRFYPADNNFSGTLPAEIGNLTALEGLAFNNNQITGPLPASIANLTSATYFEFNSNPINGDIPAEIVSMPLLTNIQLSNAGLTGSIPVGLGNLSNLVVLDLSENNLSGEIPNEISNISSLEVLNLRSNSITGSLSDDIWQLPNITTIQVDYNSGLVVTLPANLSSLTNLAIIGISGTVPIGGAFPTDFYSLTNLSVLDVGGHNFTGSITNEINNLTSLTGLWLFNNNLSGEFPDISSLSSLQGGSIAGNQFTSFPDISNLPVTYFEVNYNLLDFDAIIPNLGIPEFYYDPQNVRGDNLYQEVDVGGDFPLVNDYLAAGNVYQWVRNATDSIATTRDYTIIGAQISDLGGYFAYVTNPGVPDLTLRTPFYNIAFRDIDKSWTVDNSPGSVADFKTLYAAVYGTNEGDTLYVMGSQIPYNVGGKLLEKPRVIYGPGYFLGQNQETQASLDTAYVNQLLFKKGAEGSVVSGLDINSVIMNNQASFINDTLTNVTLSHNRINSLSINDDNRGHTISKNYINVFDFASTPVLGTSRSYIDFNISNNIIDTVTTLFAKATVARNVMANIIFDRNTIGVFTDSIESAVLNNNIINDYQATQNTNNGTIDFASANFDNNSGTLSIDNDFQSTENAGAFSGTDPYVLSGLAPIPHIYSLNDIGRIRVNVEAKNESDTDITYLNYRLGENGVVKQRGKVRRLVAGNPVNVLFRPKLGKITPGAAVTMMIWPKDANGVRGVPQTISFTAETTTATGKIFTSTGTPVTNGKVLLFEINQEATAFDTLEVDLDNQGNFNFPNIVIGDYLALGKPNADNFPGELPTYFEGTDLWEEADTLLIEATNPTFNITLLEEPKVETGPGVVAGILEEELDNTDSGGRIEARGRVKKAGVSVRRARRSSRSEEIVYDLVQYVFTNDNGEFYFENLPADNYRINIQYPGFPMDTLTNVDFVIEETKNNNYSMEALVDEGKISVTILSTTGILKDLIRAVNVYPNPTVEKITIAFNQDFNVTGNVEIDLISVTGESVYQGSYTADQINKSGELTLPVNQYQNGTYLLRINQQGKEIGTIRVMVTK
ncbi:T9SS type A sorting domain-containing protein [Fulvivirga lutimaris]|uniref:T9SS type A sorting domain-containing protein n=1 Tax=Fulvivirga lutimaris TaxID=1819566 RepID=UPI0012BD6CC6|nr:T9SS type A sorting domain-containing protein [Fulvivirga lutimaris]MTI41101.1 T9SS type A sorting domain-containing protein [Fulvivirga lutimaris]